jgi:hypothetical protein
MSDNTIPNVRNPLDTPLTLPGSKGTLPDVRPPKFSLTEIAEVGTAATAL